MTLRWGRYLTWRTVGVALLYGLPALLWGERPLRPDGVLGIYRISAAFILGCLIFVGNHVYWSKLFLPRIYRLNPKLQKETGARIVNDKGLRGGVHWEPDLGWRQGLLLQLRFLGLMAVFFCIWACIMFLVCCLMTLGERCTFW